MTIPIGEYVPLTRNGKVYQIVEPNFTVEQIIDTLIHEGVDYNYIKRGGELSHNYAIMAQIKYKNISRISENELKSTIKYYWNAVSGKSIFFNENINVNSEPIHEMYIKLETISNYKNVDKRFNEIKTLTADTKP